MPTGAEQIRWEDALDALVRSAAACTSQHDPHNALVRFLALLGSAALLNELLDGLARHVETSSQGGSHMCMVGNRPTRFSHCDTLESILHPIRELTSMPPAQSFRSVTVLCTGSSATHSAPKSRWRQVWRRH